MPTRAQRARLLSQRLSPAAPVAPADSPRSTLPTARIRYGRGRHPAAPPDIAASAAGPALPHPSWTKQAQRLGRGAASRRRAATAGGVPYGCARPPARGPRLRRADLRAPARRPMAPSPRVQRSSRRMPVSSMFQIVSAVLPFTTLPSSLK